MAPNVDPMACPCCGKKNMEAKLIQIYARLLVDWGQPLKINSGYRCEKHNTEVGGQSKSMHMLGKAIDVHMPKVDQERFIKAAKKVGFTGIGRYSNFVHIDTGRRREWGDSATPDKGQDKAA
jgi:uncharacterized protein YcbK (DUF882 family)